MEEMSLKGKDVCWVSSLCIPRFIITLGLIVFFAMSIKFDGSVACADESQTKKGGGLPSIYQLLLLPAVPQLITDSANQQCLLIEQDNWRWGDCSDNLAPMGQDGHYQLLAPDCQADLVNNDAIVLDHVTGLVWTSTDPAAGTVETYEQAKAYCEGLDYANRTDWRLPTRLEFVTILDLKGNVLPEHFHPAFGNWPDNTFWWTSTAQPGAAAHFAISGNWPWFYLFVDIGVTGYDLLARCVAETLGPLPAFDQSAIGDNRVLDARTGLEWQTEDQEARSWPEALNYCEDLTLDGFYDWRLPTLKELGTLVDDTVTGNAMSPLFVVNHDEIWSSTPLRADISKDSWNEVGYLRQSNATFYQAGYLTPIAVRCVRNH